MHSTISQNDQCPNRIIIWCNSYLRTRVIKFFVFVYLRVMTNIISLFRCRMYYCLGKYCSLHVSFLQYSYKILLEIIQEKEFSVFFLCDRCLRYFFRSANSAFGVVTATCESNSKQPQDSAILVLNIILLFAVAIWE